MSEKPFTAILGACAAVIALGASTASATPTLTLATGPDPAESITTQVVASGTTASNNDGLEVTVKPSGGQGCATNASADSGQSLYFENTFYTEGPFSRSENYTFQAAGSYLICGWLNDDTTSGDPVVASASLTVAVRAPHLALSITAPATVRPKQTFQVLTSAQAEVERTVEEFILPNTGRGCAANSDAASSTSGGTPVYWPARFGGGWSVDGGPFSETVNESFSAVGSYLICAYVEYPSSSSPPEITANATVTAVAPPPHCVVPRVRAGSTLSSTEALIRHAHCAVGHVHSTRSHRYRKGRVLRLSARAGEVLPFHTAVAIVVAGGSRR